MSNQPKELFTAEMVYDQQISPLMAKIIDICKVHRIPMIATFVYENDEEKGFGECTTYLGEQWPDRHPDVLRQAFLVLRPRTSMFSITVKKADGTEEKEIVAVLP